ncbi:hypothetical protein LCGC14_1497730 [marine sediment metagenome]|uniref:Uncharacterized protein n=1 Tax=marine sediment metagenome TaxID=412755 RepID=A0A0F9JQX8_9ZZZZ
MSRQGKKHIQAYLTDIEYKKVMTVIRNIQAGKLLDGEKCSMGKAISEMAVNYNNGAYIGAKEHKIVPYYYTEAQLQNLINITEFAKKNITNVKKTHIEEIMPEILELENDKAMLALVDRIHSRATLINIYADYINGYLKDKIKAYIKKNKVKDK